MTVTFLVLKWLMYWIPNRLNLFFYLFYIRKNCFPVWQDIYLQIFFLFSNNLILEIQRQEVTVLHCRFFTSSCISWSQQRNFPGFKCIYIIKCFLRLDKLWRCETSTFLLHFLTACVCSFYCNSHKPKFAFDLSSVVWMIWIWIVKNMLMMISFLLNYF